jgi:PAS domain S-box-containing protein
MKLSADKILLAAIPAAILVIFFILVVSLRQSGRLESTARAVSHTERVLLETQRIVQGAVDNETGARGFIITGKDEFLEPATESLVQMYDALDTLKKLIADTDKAKQWTDTFVRYIDARAKISDSMITLRRSSGVDAAANLVITGRGKHYTNRIRDLAAAIEKSETAKLEQVRSENQASIRRMNRILYGVLVAVLLLSIIIIQWVRKVMYRQKISEQKFKSLLDSAPDATVILNEKGTIHMVNDQTRNLFGYQREELIGKGVETLIPSGLPSATRLSSGWAADTDDTNARIELNAIRKNEARFPVETSLSPIRTEEGTLIYVAVRDITVRKKLEDDLKKSNSELEAFTYSVSHDLRAPLRGIVGFANILEEDYTDKLDDEAKRITGIIKTNTARMGHLIDDLLAFSRLGRQEVIKTQIDMTIMVNEIIVEIQSSDNGHSVEWSVKPLPPIQADMNLMRQVWVNLISNAVKYSGNKEQPRVEIGSFKHEGQTAFYVKDNGVGFDEQYKNKLFKVFQRLHRAEEFEGTGVGLALVEKIVSRHGGKVWAEATVEEGACFYFSLPD